jgi:hypothetical protein
VDESLYIVTWTDAFFDEGQITRDDFRSEYVVRTVGFLVRDDADILSLAQELLPDGEYRAVSHIPRQLVRSCRQLQEGAAHVRNVTARASG